MTTRRRTREHSLTCTSAGADDVEGLILGHRRRSHTVVNSGCAAAAAVSPATRADTVKTSTGTDGPAADDDYELLDYEE